MALSTTTAMRSEIICTAIIQIPHEMFATDMLGYNLQRHSCHIDALRKRQLFKFSQDVRFSENENFIVSHCHLHTTVFWKQHLVSSCQTCCVQGASDVAFSGSNGNYSSFIGIFCGICGKENSAGSLDFLWGSLHQNTVSQRSQFAE
jgi:hypothetical protein